MRLIDVRHLGRERVIGCWQLDGVLIDPGPTSSLEQLLAALGDRQPKALLLTHIHLDHAGASGSLVERWPELEVYVHRLGAPHMIDPSRLLESAQRLYGEKMDAWWGEVLPVPEGNVRSLEGGERVLDDEFEVAYTPGHAWHHVSYLYGRTAFVGDAAGVRITRDSLTVPPTPPPDIDLEAWYESIERIRKWRPDRLAITHFGAYENPDQQLDALASRLDEWAQRVREQDQEAFIAGVREEIAQGAEADAQDAFTQAAPPDQLYLGLERYWRKRAELEVPPPSGLPRARHPASPDWAAPESSGWPPVS
jgi:glyoxylase-like metal-dependent hydrolase (beta-lactamase superfamily II)